MKKRLNEEFDEKQAEEDFVKGKVADEIVNAMEDVNAKAAVKRTSNIHQTYVKGEKRVSITVDKHYVKQENSSDEFGD